ncbi:neuronal acetylcholine receptor subunit alpha-6 [Magallana gigas]|uniref:neuronal acetylcholine receptor subunit alpha-6 n=1 Tax=Magallana gigas TaxID=29159 RepID=UPI0033418525
MPGHFLIFTSPIVVILCCCAALIDITSGASVEEYKLLQSTLLTNYSTSIRPLLDQDDTVFVYSGFYLAGINEVDAVNQRLITTGFLELSWDDEFLQWDEDEFDIHTLYFKQKDIWTPDVVLKNGITTFEELGGEFYYLQVTSDGRVTWLPFQVLESKCFIDITYFPFDDQKCSITFHSWSFSKDEVNVTLFVDDPSPVDSYNYVENSVWGIVSTDAFASPEIEAESEVTFILHLRRKPLYFIVNLISPIVLLGVVRLLVFVIPADAGEKMSFAMAVFLSFAVFLSIISMHLPTNSEKTSLLGVYIVVQMIIGVGTIVISSFQLRLHHRKSERKVGVFFRGVVKVERFLRCTTCNESRKVSGEKNVEVSLHDDDNGIINWTDVSSAIDFVSFWTMLVFEISAMTIIIATLIGGYDLIG